MNASSSITIELTASELRLLHAALKSFVADFGHDEADVLQPARRLEVKLVAASRVFPGAEVPSPPPSIDFSVDP